MCRLMFACLALLLVVRDDGLRDMRRDFFVVGGLAVNEPRPRVIERRSIA